MAVAVTSFMLALCLGTASAAAQTTSLVSVSQTGTPGGADSGLVGVSISGTGRFVAFSSQSSTLVHRDRNKRDDVFVRDLQSGRTELASVNSRGRQGNGDSDFPRISASGRFVAFRSAAKNLDPRDPDKTAGVFVHDRKTGKTEQVDVSSKGRPANGEVIPPISISADGRYVAFASTATNLVPHGGGGLADIFVHDRKTDKTEQVDISSSGEAANGASDAAISGDGRFVAFNSSSANLVAGDSNNAIDVFLHDRETGQTNLASLTETGAQADDHSLAPALSADGRTIAFMSAADNLFAGQAASSWFQVFVRELASGRVEEVSVAPNGEPADGPTDAINGPAIAANGQRVVFGADAQNLVPGAQGDQIYLRDRASGATSQVSVDAVGNPASPGGFFAHPSISADGGFVAFSTDLPNLVPSDQDDRFDVFLHGPIP